MITLVVLFCVAANLVNSDKPKPTRAAALKTKVANVARAVKHSVVSKKGASCGEEHLLEAEDVKVDIIGASNLYLNDGNGLGPVVEYAKKVCAMFTPKKKKVTITVMFTAKRMAAFGEVGEWRDEKAQVLEEVKKHCPYRREIGTEVVPTT